MSMRDDVMEIKKELEEQEDDDNKVNEQAIQDAKILNQTNIESSETIFNKNADIYHND